MVRVALATSARLLVRDTSVGQRYDGEVQQRHSIGCVDGGRPRLLGL